MCVNEESLDIYASHLKVAVNSAILIGNLEPHLLFDGEPERLRQAVGHKNFVIHTCKSSLTSLIRDTSEVPGWSRRIAEGALLRLEIPLIENSDEFVLYTDCDVIFTRKMDLSHCKPKFIGAAPGHNPCNFIDICSGVMVLNVENLRSEYDGCMKVAAENLGIPHFYDQEVLNKYFVGKFDQIPLEYHWKAYWEPNPFAYIVHFHGVKRDHMRMIVEKLPGHDGLYQWSNLLFMQENGLKYYAKLFDTLDCSEKVSKFGLFLRSLPMAFNFFRKALTGFFRKLRPPSVPPGFDEDFYVYANPDVAIALHNGWIPSGWWHYDRQGRKEGRAAQFRPTL